MRQPTKCTERLRKLKKNGRADKIAGLPDNAIIDNDATMHLEDIDKAFLY